MKPIVGLMPLFDDEKDSFWMLPGYMKMLQECGAFPIMLPLTDDLNELEECIRLCDGLLFTGGHDVNPAIYGKKTGKNCGEPCELRDKMECSLLKMAFERDMPILGICRGIQIINAYLGGDLYQDLPTEFDITVEHHMKPPYDRPAHEVEVMPDTLLAKIIGTGRHEVNSYHHQAIRTPADAVTVMAVSEDGLIEAISVNEKSFAVGVQWHPEFSYQNNTDSRKLIHAFVDALPSRL